MAQFLKLLVLPLTLLIHVESGQVLLLEALNFANNIDLRRKCCFTQK